MVVPHGTYWAYTCLALQSTMDLRFDHPRPLSVTPQLHRRLGRTRVLVAPSAEVRRLTPLRARQITHRDLILGPEKYPDPDPIMVKWAPNCSYTRFEFDRYTANNFPIVLCLKYACQITRRDLNFKSLKISRFGYGSGSANGQTGQIICF